MWRWGWHQNCVNDLAYFAHSTNCQPNNGLRLNVLGYPLWMYWVTLGFMIIIFVKAKLLGALRHDAYNWVLCLECDSSENNHRKNGYDTSNDNIHVQWTQQYMLSHNCYQWRITMHIAIAYITTIICVFVADLGISCWSAARSWRQNPTVWRYQPSTDKTIVAVSDSMSQL